jgi:hypothetical protein
MLFCPGRTVDDELTAALAVLARSGFTFQIIERETNDG